uniref:Ribonuclease H n=1 Tax=Blastobotrys adeninivorans TaxID=409370 RepID=A0A060TD98_BLAAD
MKAPYLSLLDKMGKYYAVANGRRTGVFNSWDACKESTNGYSGARFKSFSTAQEAQAFVNSGGNSSSRSGGYSGGHSRGSSGGYSGGYSRSSSGGYSRGYSGPYARSSGSSSGGYPSGYAKNYSGKSSGYSSGSTSQKSVPYEDVYTDGSARGNGRSNATGGIGVYYGEGDSRNVSEPLTGERQTNQRAELTAAIRALEQAKAGAATSTKGIRIITDSEYTINSFTKWADKWEKTGYSGVKNEDLIKEGRQLIKDIDSAYQSRGYDRGVTFQHVPGHSGVHGNEAADRLANKGAGF